MREFEYVITDELGLHARPAGMLVKEAGKFVSAVSIARGEKKVDAKKIFGVMGMAVKCGDTIVITADGEDEDDAIAAMEAFVQANL